MILVMLVSITTVVASDVDDSTTGANDNNLTVQNSADDTVVEAESQEMINTEPDTGGDQEDTLSASSDEDVLSATGTFNDLYMKIRNEYAAGRTIYLDQDYNNTASYSCISISSSFNNLIIDGQGHTIDGNYRNRIFDISYSKVTFKNIKFINGKMPSYEAGAIKTTGNLDIINCTFENNYCGSNEQYTGGGAIRITGQSKVLNIWNSTFNKNYAFGCGGALNAGTTNGAIYIYNSTFIGNYETSNSAEFGGGVGYTNANTRLYIYDSNFINNTANSEGGCFRHSGLMVVNNSYFDSNKAVDGGALMGGNPNNSNSVISNSTFINNYASRWGGAIQERKCVVNNCTFINNSANLETESTSQFGPHGGAIYARDYFYIYDSRFIENKARKGGAICMEYRVEANVLQNCIFEKNSAVQEGGAIHIDTANTVPISYCSFTNNSAPSGGAIYIHHEHEGNVEIQYSNFTHNSATNGSGGAIYGDGATLIIKEYTRFINNTATQFGGAIYSDNVVIRDYIYFEKNNATYGGAVYAIIANIKYSEFISNSAQYGGSIYDSSSLSSEANTFEKNSALYGGAVYAVVISSSVDKFHNNNATVGGAIYADGSGSLSRIEDSEFKGNNATQLGGAIYWNAAQLNIISTKFISNYAGADAGALYWKKGAGRISKSTFTSNKALKDGGAIYWDAANGYIYSDTIFENNNAGSKGGAIYWNGANGKIGSTTFTNNDAGFQASSIYWGGSNGVVSTSTFNGQSSLGSIFWTGVGGEIADNTFNKDKAIYVYDTASVSIKNNNQNWTSYDNYSINNHGNISLEGNELHNAIHNNGLILTDTSVIVLDNQTIVTAAKYYDIYTEVLDDNGNYIKLQYGLTNLFETTPYTATFNNTHYVFKSPYLNLGVHPVTATANFTGLSTYVVKSGVLMYMILDLNVTIVNYGESVVINTTVVNTTENGTARLVINEQEYNVTISNGSGVLVLHNVAPGKYEITAYYGVFNQTIDSEFEYVITLRNSTIIINVTDVLAGQNTTININVTNGTTGTVYVFINSKMYILTLTNSSAQLNLTNLPGGVYPIYATYNGDDRFRTSYNNTSLKVTKLNATLPIIVRNNILAGETYIVTINATSNLTGTLTVYLDGKQYTFARAPAAFTITSATAGNHTIRVVYSGDDKYNPATNNTTYVVGKHKMDLSITAKDIKVGDNETITISVPRDAKGIVLLTVNKNQYYINVNETKSMVLSGLAYGKYNVTATYIEDDMYYTNSTNASFIVDYVDIALKPTYTVDKDLNVVVNVTLPNDVNGDIVIEVNGTNYTSYINKGKFSVAINGLDGGVYPAKLYFANDTKYRPGTQDFSIILTKINPTIRIISEHIEVGDNATIRVVVPEDAGGNITLGIDNKNYTKTVENGAAVFTVSGLVYGNYTILAKYSGDRKYNSTSENEILIVRKVDPNPYSWINVTDIFVGEIATFNITMPSDLTTKINLTVQNITHVVNITNGFGQINISGLKYGLPVPVHASFSGNEKYLRCERDYPSFSVHRITNYPINITAKTNDTSANITVTLPNDANGLGNITIDNRVFPVTYVNGKANVTVNGLTSGQQYVVVAHFYGDDKYTEGEAARTLNSNKTLDYVFNATAKDITVGQIAYIHIALPNITNGTVTLRVPGRDPISVNVNDTFENGTYDFPVYNLAAGSYLCSVTYSGNDKYESSTRYGTLVVSKIHTSPRINFNTTYVGQNLTIQVTLPDDSNGTINITINDKVYNATVVNGTALVTIPGLTAKTYYPTLFYSGNEKYNNRTQPFEVTILKVREFIFDLGVIDIYVGDNETITVRLPSDIDVNVVINIPGTPYINQVIQLTNGTATFNATGLKVGRYNVTANITGSVKYMDRSVTRYFTVSPIDDYLFNLHNVNVTIVRDNITFVLDLPKDATGNVTVFIFNKNHTAEVKDGSATVKVPTTAQGNYQFTISFKEEGKYVYKSQSGYAFVVKTDPAVNLIYNASVNVDENVTITFNLSKDATGNVSVTSRGVTYTAKLVNGSANVTVRGYPLASTYSPSISYTGDDRYNPYTDTIVITANKVTDYNITVNVSNITVDDMELVNISIPSDATEDVLVSGNFSDSTFSVKLTNGNATFAIKDLPAGTYYINVRYQGYQKYADKNVTKIFRVDKVVPPIAIDFINNNTIIVRLPSLANGLANITIGNDLIKTQINITNGVGSLDVSTLRPGNYSVNATFLGGARYLQNSTNATITIPKIKDYILPITVRDITVGENATISIVAPYNATGKMNLTLNGGNVIEVQIKDGVATYNATKLAVGNYTVVVSYKDDEYEFQTNSSKFEVVKVKTVISPILRGNSTSITVNVTLTEGVSGNLTITIGKTNYNFTNLKTNKINLTVPSIPGDHDIVISYSGDENHTDAYYKGLIVTEKIKDYTLLVNATQIITVLDTNVITVTIPKGIEGNVHIYINGQPYPFAPVNPATGKATFTLPRLASGTYNVTASFSNDVYDEVENTTNFTVIKLNTTIKVDVENITKDLTEIINVTVNSTAGGYVYIDIIYEDGEVVTFRADVEVGVASLVRSNIRDGNYTVVATYMGDNIFNQNSTTAKFTVSKIPVNITITAKDIVIGQEANFTINTSRPITDQVTVRIGNRNYTAILYNGVGTLMVLGQNIGTHNVTVIYEGDDDYLPANDTINITVHDKLPTSVKVNVTNITVGETVTIYVNVTGAQNGTVTIYMMGNPIVKTVVNGTANFTYSNLTARGYHFTVEYNENTFYKSSTATGDFTVFKKSAPISATVTNATVGDTEYINVYLPTNATGNILLSVNGSNYYSPLKGGVARFNVTGLAIGNHTAHITFRGDDNYLANETDINLTTAKRVLTINITSEKPVIVIGHPVVFIIQTSANVTEVVTVKIIDRTTNAEVSSNNTFVENGKGTYTVLGLAAGNYTAKVIFAGNSQYDRVTNKTNFTVSGKLPTSLNISVANIVLGENATIYVNVTGALTGRVTLNMAGNPQTKDVVDGKVNFTVSGLSARDYHVTVTYVENDNYLTSTNATDFTVYRKNSTVSINATNILVGETEVFNVTVTPGATGYVLISFADVKHYVDINTTNNFLVPVADLPVGEYNVTITYSGDSNYFNSTGNSSFNITKRVTPIVISCNPIIIEGHSVTFAITTNSTITEVVTIRVNGTNYTSFVVNGRGNYTVYNLPSGNHTAYVYLAENSRFKAASNHTNFTVTTKLPSKVTIVNVTDVTVGDNVVIRVNVTKGATGTVSLSIYGQVINMPLVNGTANFTVSNLPAREFPFTVYYRGDNNYLTSNATGHVTVNKKVAAITLNVTNSYVDEVDVINVTVPENATGHVLISLGEMHVYAQINGSNVLNVIITELPIGEYNVTAEYVGDENFTSAYANAAFNVTKRNVKINITCDPVIIDGHPVTFNIQTDYNITSVITIRVNGTNYTSFIQKGKGTYTVYGLKTGSHTAEVFFDGNERYNDAYNKTDFVMTGKYPVSIKVKVANITLGQNATVYVNVTDMEGNPINSGNVTLNIAGRPQNKAVVNGKVNFTVADLIARDYHVTATYSGTDDYLSNSTSTDFTVFRKESDIKINVTSINVGQNETIKINVTSGATGIVLIDIAGIQVYARLNNSYVEVLFDDLGVGTYNVTATYMGDDKYFNSTTNASFTVTKLDTSIIIEGSNITVVQTETFNITTSANITSVIFIEIDGTNYTSFIENGKGTFTVPFALAAKKYTVYVYLPENDRYNAVRNSTNITVSAKKASAVTVNAASITVGDEMTIYVNVTDGATGNVAVSIAGNVYNLVLNNSRANVTIKNLTARNYHVSAIYIGDDYYLSSRGTADFVVNKKVSALNVTATNITVDSPTTISVKITNGTTGVVLIDINGTDYYATIENGAAVLTVKNLAVGTYNVTVIYEGDANYTSSVNSTKFSVSKLNSQITVQVLGNEKVAQGNDVLINVTGPKDATGIAVVTVKHGSESEDYTVYINNGEGLLIVSKPHVAHYTVTATYQENYKYLSNVSNTDEFEVYASGVGLDVDTHNIHVGDNETITISVQGNYSGNIVNITIDGNIKFTAPLVYNAAGNVSVAKYNYTGRLVAGIHKVDAVFVSDEGDRNITHSGSSTFIVSKNNSTVGILPISNIKVGQNNTIELTILPSDATGTIDVYVNGERHTVNVNNLTLKLTGLAAGHYVVQAMYGGDAKYLASSANATFDVYKNNITVKLEVVDIKVGDTQYLNVTLADDAQGHVLININGTRYYAEIRNGVASVNVTGLQVGKHDVNVTFVGDDKYYANSTTGSFNVTKLDTSIVIKGYDIIVGQDVVLNITTSANLTEVVYIEVNGVNQTAFIKDGKGNFTLTGLNVGPQTVKVYFPGNTQYGAIDNETTFTVSPKIKTSINVTVADITVGENITVYVNATKGINGPVYVTIAGVAYTRELVDGKVNFTVSGLIARDYVVSAFFMGNTEYELCNTTSTFKVHKKDTPITIEVTDIKVGETEIINVTVDSNATGNVLISIGSIHVYADLNKGRASVNITGLGVGKHNVTVTYVGDGNYNGNETNGSFEVTKLKTSITIETNNTYIGQPVEFIIKTSANFTEVVTVTIGNKTYHTFVENGTGSLVLYDLPVGPHTAVVNFPGNTQYDDAENSTDFEVYAKKASEVTVKVESITVGQNATIRVNITKGATGSVTIVLAGHEYTSEVNSTTGEVTFNIENLTARNYVVTAIYHGDTYYNSNSSDAEFTVSKLASSVDLEVKDILVGETEIINVTVTPGATGVVLINISGTCYYADLGSGMPTFTIEGLKPGNYEAVVTYMGDNKYANSTASKTFTVQAEITLTAGANNGNTTPVTVDVGDENATGEVTVVVDGVPYTAKVENGTATVNINGSNPGVKDATVTYTPEGKDPIVQNTTVDIPKVSEYPVNVEVVNVDKANGTATIKVQAPSDATGNATIKIGDQTIPVTLDENGTAIVTVKDIPVGSHDIDVSYDGDDKYVSKSNRTHVNMPINLPTVNVVDHLVRGWNSQFDYEAVFTNEFGEVLVDTEITFIVNGKAYKVKTESHGIARLSETLPVGEYTISSVNPVTGETVTKKLSIVPRIIYNKDLTMDFKDGSHWDVLVIGDDGKPVGEGEIIDIYVNTIHYVAKTDKNGYAKLAINLNPANYKISAEYKNYKVINKLKVKQTLKLVKKTVKVKKGKKLVLKAKLKWSNGKAIKGKVIKFKFNKKTYKAKTNSKGIAKVTVKSKVTKKLKKGKKYTYTATYITNTVKGKVSVK